MSAIRPLPALGVSGALLLGAVGVVLAAYVLQVRADLQVADAVLAATETRSLLEEQMGLLHVREIEVVALTVGLVLFGWFAAFVAGQALSSMVRGAKAGQQRVDGVSRLLETVVDSIREQAGRIHRTAYDASEIVTRARYVAVEARERSQSVARTAECVSLLDERIATLSAIAPELADAVESASVESQVGSIAVARSSVILEDLATAIARLLAKLEDVERGSAVIGNVASTIDDVADQTNRLAFDAAIEAAREPSSGVATVASQIRRAADCAKFQAREAARITREVRACISSAVTAAHATKQLVEEGRAATGRAARAHIVLSRACDGSLRAAQSLTIATQMVQIARADVDEGMQLAPRLEEQATAVEELGARAQRVSDLAKGADDAALLLQTQVDVAAERMCLVARPVRPLEVHRVESEVLEELA